MRKPAQLISAFVFDTQIVRCIYFINSKFKASSNFFCLVGNNEIKFSHDAAYLYHLHLSLICSLFKLLPEKNENSSFCAPIED